MKKIKQHQTEGRFPGGILIRITFPVSLPVTLFGMTIFLLLLPLIEEKLMEGI